MHYCHSYYSVRKPFVFYYEKTINLHSKLKVDFNHIFFKQNGKKTNQIIYNNNN